MPDSLHRHPIADNPLRILGVYVDDNLAAESSNYSRICAFSKIGQDANLSMPMDAYLPAVSRLKADAEAAIQSLALPTDRVRHSLFWYAKDTSRPWAQHLNAAVEAMINKDFALAVYHYESLIFNPDNFGEFISVATKGLNPCEADEAARYVVDEIDTTVLMDQLKNTDVPRGVKFLQRIFTVDGNILQEIDAIKVTDSTYDSYCKNHAIATKVADMLTTMAIVLGEGDTRVRAYTMYVIDAFINVSCDVLSSLVGKCNKDTSVDYLQSCKIVGQHIGDDINDILRRIYCLNKPGIEISLLVNNYNAVKVNNDHILDGMISKARRKRKITNALYSVLLISGIIALILA